MDAKPCPFDDWWARTPIPAEIDSWDECDRQRWIAVCRSAFEAGQRAIPAELRDLIDCWKANYGLDRYDKVTAARRWAEAGGPSDGPIMALATAIEWLEST